MGSQWFYEGVFVANPKDAMLLDVKRGACVSRHFFSPVAGSDEIRTARQPFALLDKTSVSQRGESVMKLAAPSLLNDYCTKR